jgi:hypothetical protein
MKSMNWTAILALSLGGSLMAGCGQAPSPTATGPAGTAAASDSVYVGPLAAQEGTGTMPTPSAATPMPADGAATPTDGSTGGNGMPAAPVASAMPAAPVPDGTATGIPPAGGVAVPPVAGTGVLGDVRIGGVNGVIGKALDRGLGAFAFGAGALVAFQSDRDTGGGGGKDIFVYDAAAQTVLALPAVNTYANEVNPRLSVNAQWLVYQTDENGSDDIRVFDLSTQLIDTLRTLNTEFFDEREPDISDDGNLIVYVSNEGDRFSHHRGDKGGYDDKGKGNDDWDKGDRGKNDDCNDCNDGYNHFKTGGDSLFIYNTHNGANYAVPVANRGLGWVTWPTISGNGEVIAYGGSDGGRKRSDIFVYSIRDAAQLTPPFINDAKGNQYDPDLNAAGDLITFVSDRRGSEDIYICDLKSGFTDNLVLANTDCVEQEPRFLGPLGDRIVFQSDRTGKFRIFAYDIGAAILDTLPVAHEFGSNDQLRTFRPHI